MYNTNSEKEYEITFNYSAKILQRSFLSMTWRCSGGYIVGSAIVFLFCIMAVASPHYRPLGAFGLGVVSAFWYYLLSTYGQVHFLFSDTDSDNTIRIAFNEKTCSFESAHGFLRVNWDAFSQIYQLNEFIVFIRKYDKYGFIPIPIAEIDSKALRFLKNKVTDNMHGRTK